MEKRYTGHSFYEQFEAGNQGGTGTPPGEKESIAKEAGHEEQSNDDLIDAGFVFVNPLPIIPRSTEGRRIIQRLRKSRQGGKDHSPGPNNPSKAK